ncbi:FAD-linked oxidoreductase-like protein [Fimicolochytrium jonesii]|uniref:FAD-linked oxidoreductase-like protein n=1 Tax=Fimicolochytrium jonesii TaxID=1396493 RepID=UPI0022FE23A8|nr:FAD-linked oxidoreductase-like protein [Fimicolochytrium jonesii]KAI8823586.1 FAD-linked oxidoreductase-like protein [Fimicolochytrium jonesii]
MPLTPPLRHITGPSAPVKAAAAAHHAVPTQHNTTTSPTPPSGSSEAKDLRPYANRTTAELINSLLVFQLCGMPRLVEASPTILEWTEKMKLHGIAYAIIKRTFFKHFCGGEDLKEVVPTLEAFKKNHVGGILDLAMEADMDEASLAGPAALEQARKVANMFKESVDIASQTTGSFIAVKITALLPPSVLLAWSNTLNLLHQAFTEADSNKDGKITAKEFEKLSSTFPLITGQTAKNLFEQSDRDKDGSIDWIDLSETFTIYNNEAARALIRKPLEPQTPDNPLITAELLDTAAPILPEIDSVAQHAKDLRVRIMVDAEQTYFQPAVDDVALVLCKKFNPSLKPSDAQSSETHSSPRGPIVYNTYQLYLRDTYANLVTDVERAERAGYALGVKIVRGAYMHAERERAEAIGIPDPIQPDIKSTHKAYDAAIDFLVGKVAKGIASTASSSARPITFVVASHNAHSIQHARKAMAAANVAPNEGSIAFAQLMGMQDGTTFSLAAQGYKVFKYIPYGPVDVTIPYLQRRALENQDILKPDGGVAQDRASLIRELKIRFGGNSGTVAAARA